MWGCTRTGSASFDTPEASLLACFRSLRLSDGAVPFAYQADDSLAHPIAAVGDTLYAVNVETRAVTPVAVTAVRALRGS